MVCQQKDKKMGGSRRHARASENDVLAPPVRTNDHYVAVVFQIMFDSLRGQRRPQKARSLRCVTGTTVAYFVRGVLG